MLESTVSVSNEDVRFIQCLFVCLFLGIGLTFIYTYSFIHSGDLYSASSRDYYSEALPAQSRTKKIGAMVWRCILGLARAYLRDLCRPTPGTRGRSSLQSSEQGLLFVPFARTSTTQARAFSVVGPSVWNWLPLSQRLLPRILSDTFYSSLKTLLFSRARVGSASE